ncbi:hypothetical protein EJ08DRAFT_646867 [Tothia fuscella]|uniref:CAP-Gly domain-containing protein n=1 Tax=Tothia fuscella TaxID=1048955 RepID=A0A9P4NYG2_9PEZI|nr:hypothetical protein EJ08DRAFT_646867 [Tothia fuscella]
MAQFKLGQRVELPDGKQAFVRYIGKISIREGEWLGLELDDASGKNDGSVRGDKLFDCPPNHGLFMQPSAAIQIIEQPKPPGPKVANGKPVGTAARPRPSSVVAPPGRTARPSMGGPSVNRQSISGPLGSRQSMTASPAKRVSMAGPPPVTRPESKRTSMAPPSLASRSSRQSLAPRSLSPKKPAPSAQSSRRSSVGPSATTTRPPVRSPTQANSDSPSISRVLSPGSTTPSAKVSTNSKPVTTSSSSNLTPRASAAQSKQTQELEAKVRALEKKAMSNRDRNKDYDALQEKNQQYETIHPKLEAKVQGLSRANHDLKEQLRQLQESDESIETLKAEHESMIDLAVLDKELAEEKADSYQRELDSIRGRLEELELENEILKGENEELAKDMSPEERSSQGWLQMQRENDRLREALLKMRDWSQEQAYALRNDIKTMEAENRDLAKIKEEYDNTKAKYLEARAEIEDLREQLEAAEGSEDMIEQLTEKNMTMSEKIEELQNAVDEYQSLVELNDEIEIGHMEDQKQLQNMIDQRDSILADQTRRATQQEEEINDREYTISRFRDLVTNMQSDLEDMRASKQITESEAQELGNHSRTMMDLNRQLQASAMSTKVKTIEMELKKMEAEEASEHLAIVKLFLPEAFHAERDSILALLRFKRIGFKSRLLHGFMKDRVASPGPHAQSNHLLAACDAVDKLTWISAMCERFTNSIAGSSLNEFARFESSLYELEPVERTLDGYVENLRKDELREQQVADGLQRSIAVMTHLSELHLRDGLESYAEEILMKTLLMQSNLETTAAALNTTKSEIQQTITASEDRDDEISIFIQRADTVISQSRSAKVIVGKIIRSLQELKARSLALTSESQPNFESCQTTTENLTASLRTLGLAVHNSIHEEGRTTTFGLSDLLTIVRNFNATHFDATDGDVFAPLQAKMKALHERLSDIYTVATDINFTAEFERPQPPWVLRSRELADSTTISASAEAEISTLKRNIHERATTIKLRDQTLEESNVKIELLEARMKDVSKKVERINELEKAVDDARGIVGKLERKIEDTAGLRAKLEEERDRWMRKAAELKSRDPNSSLMDAKRGGIDLVGTSAEMEGLKRDVTVLEDTVRFLRRETRRKRSEEDAMPNSWLRQPLVPVTHNADIKAKERESRDALGRLAELPRTAKPLILEGMKDRNERLKWRPRKETPQYRLCELEMQWLEAWEPGIIAVKGGSNWLGGLGPGITV